MEPSSPEGPLLIVGASARAAAFSAARAGFTPLALDRFADADLVARHDSEQVTPYPAALPERVAAHPSVPLMYLGALENHPALVDRLANGRKLFGNPASVLRQVRDPFQLASTLGDRDLLFPEVRRSREGLPHDGSWLSKPLRSCGGTGITPYDGSHDAVGAGPGTYFQGRLEGHPCAAVYVAAQGSATLLGVTRQLIGNAWTGAVGFQYCGSIGPLSLPDSQNQQFCRLGEVLAREFGLTGLFGIDVIVQGDHVWCIEVNPRYTASVEVIERGQGIAAVELHVQAFREAVLPAEPKEPLLKCTEMAGKAILYARQQIDRKDTLWKTLLDENRHKAWPDVTDIPPAGTVIPAQAPILTLWATGSDVVEVEKALRTRADEFVKRLAS